MTIVVNGAERDVQAGSTVAEVVLSLTSEERGVAVAVDGEVVPRGDWRTTMLVDGQHVEVLRAVQGG
jgi:sulfur carrier protein